LSYAADRQTDKQTDGAEHVANKHTKIDYTSKH